MDRSIICHLGRDNGPRFLAITGSCYLVMSLSALLLGLQPLLYAVTLMLLPLLALTGIRRLRDSQLPAYLVFALLIPFVGYSSVLAHNLSPLLASFWLLLGLVLSTGLALRKSPTKADYIQGYDGPAKSATVVRQQHQRVEPRVEPLMPGEIIIEPSLDLNQEMHQLNDNFELHRVDRAEIEASMAQAQQNLAEQGSLTALLQQYYQLALQYRYWLFGLLIGLLLLSSSILVWHYWPQSSASTHEPAEVIAPVTEVIAPLPDGFSLVLAEQQLLMRWHNPAVASGVLWSQASAKGDSDCAYLMFNNGNKYRPLTVTVSPEHIVQADFSALDTQGLIRDMAKRNSVQLCGQQFSLKGSGAVLTARPEFNDYL